MVLAANQRGWDKLPTPFDRTEWQMTPQTVNAYNDINSNVIAFPAAILQIPYFHADIPSYLNFGATGWTVGHEVSHAFDNHGREFDSDGKYGDDWWTNRTDTEFTRLSQCFVEQYANYTVEGLDGSPLHLDGEQTLGENIADAGGIDTAFLAWQKHRKDYPEQDTDLPGLEKWSHEQLFFIGFANSWCSSTSKQSLIQQVFADVHSPSKFRVKGTLENSKYFKEHFNCPVKEPKCKIW
jgi:endothelin-converting enzyme